MLGERLVVEVTFATALSEHDRSALPGPVCFITPPDALRRLGVAWALQLQGHVRDWCADSELILDVTSAPGFGLQALIEGQQCLYCSADDPVFRDLKAYAGAQGVRVIEQRPIPQESWTPNVPRRKRKRRSKSDT